MNQHSCSAAKGVASTAIRARAGLFVKRNTGSVAKPREDWKCALRFEASSRASTLIAQAKNYS
jgi:hypothetical protein